MDLQTCCISDNGPCPVTVNGCAEGELGGICHIGMCCQLYVDQRHIYLSHLLAIVVTVQVVGGIHYFRVNTGLPSPVDRIVSREHWIL